MNKTVLITGAGRGLGRALAEKFQEGGWHVIATDLLPELLTDLEAKEGYTCLPMDVTSDVSVQDAFKKIRTTVHTLDLIIGNAGIDIYFPLSEADVEHIHRIFEVNFFGVYRVNQVFGPLLKKPGGGIIAIGSESLHITMPFLSYPVTKRALENYMMALRQELWFSGRWATVVRCGPIRTRIVENLLDLKSEVEGTSLDPVFRTLAKGVAREIGKVMEPSTVADMIYRIAGKTKPGAVYRINNRLVLRMLKWMPFRIVEWAVRKKLQKGSTA